MNDINFELYKTFYLVAKYKNLTKAADKLFISQPAVTQIIKKLEDQIGYKLFFRTKQGMELTEEGIILFDYLKVPIECLDKGKDKIKETVDEDSKVIRIGSGSTLIRFNLLKPLKEFKKNYPNIKIEIVNGITYDLLDKLKNDFLDIVILNLPYKIEEDFKLEVINEAEDIFVGSMEFIHLKNKTFTFEDLNSLPLALQASVSNSRKTLDKICAKHNVELSSSYELGSYSLVMDFVKEGLGIGYLNKKHIEKELNSGELFQLKTNFKIPLREVGAVIHKKKEYNETLNKFINYLKSIN